MLHFGLEVLSFLLKLLFSMKGKPLGPTLKQSIFSFYNRKDDNLHWLVEPWSNVGKQEYLRNVCIFDNKHLMTGSSRDIYFL